MLILLLLVCESTRRAVLNLLAAGRHRRHAGRALGVLWSADDRLAAHDLADARILRSFYWVVAGLAIDMALVAGMP